MLYHPTTAEVFHSRLSELVHLHNVLNEEPSLELWVTLLNINLGYSEDQKKACKTLNDYSVYTARVRLYAETTELEDAVNRTINECIRKGILAEFLSRNKAEAMKKNMNSVIKTVWQPDANLATKTD